MVNIHLTDDTRIQVRIVGQHVALAIGNALTIYLDTHDQLAELIQACDVASKTLY
jgi:hypothetical protein